MKRLIRTILVALAITVAGALTSHAAWAASQAQGQSSQPAPQGQKDQQTQTGNQAAPAPTAQQKAAEQRDYAALQSELDPARQIEMVDDFAKKYPTSSVLAYAYAFAAGACQQKGAIGKEVEYGEKSLQLKPDNLMGLLLMAGVLATPQALANTADKDKQLSEAEADATKALQIISTAPNDLMRKPPNITDEQFAMQKAGLSNEMHSDLGMVHLQRATLSLTGVDKAELAKAEDEYKTALKGDHPNPADEYRLGECYNMDGKIDEAIDAFTKASQLGQGTGIQSYADNMVAQLKQKKAKAAPKQ